MSAPRPKTKAVPPYAFRPMELCDLAAVVEIERLSSTNPWPRDAFRHEVEASTVSHPRVAVASGKSSELAGFCVYWIVLDELSVQNVAVHPRHRGRGLGRKLVASALEEGRARGARVALLEVRRGNVPARRLYEALGLEPCGERRDYYSRPREDAVLYRKTL